MAMPAWLGRSRRLLVLTMIGLYVVAGLSLLMLYPPSTDAWEGAADIVVRNLRSRSRRPVMLLASATNPPVTDATTAPVPPALKPATTRTDPKTVQAEPPTQHSAEEEVDAGPQFLAALTADSTLCRPAHCAFARAQAPRALRAHARF